MLTTNNRRSSPAAAATVTNHNDQSSIQIADRSNRNSVQKSSNSMKQSNLKQQSSSSPKHNQRSGPSGGGSGGGHRSKSSQKTASATTNPMKQVYFNLNNDSNNKRIPIISVDGNIINDDGHQHQKYSSPNLSHSSQSSMTSSIQLNGCIEMINRTKLLAISDQNNDGDLLIDDLLFDDTSTSNTLSSISNSFGGGGAGGHVGNGGNVGGGGCNGGNVAGGGTGDRQSDDPGKCKVKNSPKHLLYEVLLSPIKRKSRNTSKNASKSAGNTDKDKPTNDHQQNQESMNKNNKMAANISKQSQSSTGQNNYQNNQRSQSTTPIDFITDETGQLLSAAATSAAINRNLFDDDPGIMSEIETSSTGFNNRYNHRVQIPNKFRQSLPIVRTPSKSLDRSLGLVFLQFRNETKRALLPNEITSIDTVKALFVRSFPKQLSMEYLDMNLVRIYIHDSNKNMFYELEDLKDVKDRCILRIYEQNVNGPQPANGNMANLLQQQQQHIIGIQPTNPHAENYGYFSEPEFDSEYHQQQQQQQQHRKRFPSPSMLQQQQSMMTIGGGAGGAPPPQSQYYGTIMLPPQFRSATLGPRTANFFINQSTIQQQQQQQSSRNKPFQNYSQTLPRGTHLMNPQTIAAAINPFVQPPPKPQRNFLNNQPPPVPPQPADIIMIQARPIAPQAQQQQQSNPGDSQQQQQQQQSAAPTIIPYNRPLPDRPYSVAGHYPNMDRGTAAAAAGQMTRFQFPAIAANINEFSGYLSSPEHRTLPSNATLIQSIQANGQMRPSYAGHHQPTGPPPPPPPLPTYPPSAARLYHHDPAALISTATTNAIVTNPNIIVGPHRHPPLPPPHNPATINDEDARIRMQEMERKIASLTSVVSKALTNGAVGPPALPPPSANKPQPPPKPQSLINAQMNANLSQENVGQLRQIRRKARDLRQEIKQLKRFTVQQLNASREMMKENCDRIQNSLAKFNKTSDSVIRLERLRISNNCDEYNEDAQRLDHDLLELEAKVEALRSNVINRRCRVNMSNVESMALILSRASKTVADLKSRYPLLAKNLKTIMKKELNEIEKEEKFLKEEPERLEQSLKRCKKLTGTLVTLKRLASVQEQRSSSSSNHGSSSPQLLQQQQQQSKDGKKDSNFSGSGDENSSASINKSTGEQKRSTTLMNDLHHQSSKSFDADIMEPHTIIQVTPATPSSTDSSKLTTTNILDNLLDELQTFTKQHSKERGSSRSGHNHCKIQRTLSHGTFNTCTNSNSIDDKSIINDDDDLLPNDGTIVRKASRSKSYSSIRATSEPPSGIRSKISSLTDGRIDNLDNLAMLASTCGNAAAATAALLEKRFAQSRQELLEQRHQELLYKQRQLQQQYTRLQQLSSKRSSSSSSSTTTTSNQQRSFNDNGDTNNNTAAHPGGGGGGNDTNNNNQSNTVIMEKNAAAIAASTAATNNQSAKIVHKTFETEIL